MTNDLGPARAGAGIAVLWLLGLAVTDLLVPPSVSPDPLFAIAPLIAAAVLSTSATIRFAAAAVVLVVVSGWWNETWGSAQQWVRLVDVALVGAAAVVIAEVRVRRERRFARVANIAEVAQRAILPTLPHTAADVSVTARYQSAARDAVVGGDLYDCSLVGNRVRFLVGDVRGKGVAAVEQAARVIRAFRQSAATQATLVDIARDMDEYLTPFMGEEDFVTAVLVDVTDDDSATVLSCGHPPPLLIRSGAGAELLELPAGVPLGVGLGGSWQARTVSWRPQDRLLLYTDGLSEARDAKGRFLPILELAADAGGSTAEAALDGLIEGIRHHVRAGALDDDLALVLLENAKQVSLTGSPAAPSGVGVA